MYPESDASGNPEVVHRLAVVIPRGEDDERWIEFAGRKLAERFGSAHGVNGLAGLETEVETIIIPVVVVFADVDGEPSELDMAIVYGIGLQVHEHLQRVGVAVMIDDDIFVF